MNYLKLHLVSVEENIFYWPSRMCLKWQYPWLLFCHKFLFYRNLQIFFEGKWDYVAFLPRICVVTRISICVQSPVTLWFIVRNWDCMTKPQILNWIQKKRNFVCSSEWVKIKCSKITKYNNFFVFLTGWYSSIQPF